MSDLNATAHSRCLISRCVVVRVELKSKVPFEENL